MQYIGKIMGIVFVLALTAVSAFALPNDSLKTKKQISFSDFKTYPYNSNRVRLVVVGQAAGYSATLTSLYFLWYKGYPQSGFHFTDDHAEWLQVDKVGHAYSAYIESYASMEMWRWAGVSRKKQIWFGGLTGLAYQTIIESLDGFSREWGWSWGDMGANVFGSGLLIGQELAWNEQRIRYKFSFHRKEYNDPGLDNIANNLYGQSLLQRMVKDYNGQTYWLSANVKSFFPTTTLPAWLNFSVGYGAENLFGAVSNTGAAASWVPYRQYYIAPDIDLTKIKTRSKILRFAFGVFGAFKFPLPAFEINKNGTAWHWILF